MGRTDANRGADDTDRSDRRAGARVTHRLAPPLLVAGGIASAPWWWRGSELEPLRASIVIVAGSAGACLIGLVVLVAYLAARASRARTAAQARRTQAALESVLDWTAVILGRERPSLPDRPPRRHVE